MLDRRLVTVVSAAIATALVALAPQRVGATQRFGPIQLSGNLQTTNLIRHPDASSYQFVQNRNVARVRLDYDWLKAGKFYDKYTIPFIESSHLFILWRGVYDSVYDTTPGFRPHEDIHASAYGGDESIFQYAQTHGIPRRRLTLSGLSHGERDALKFDNQLREAYVDIKFRGLPLTVRAGRQQIVWGETDNNRLLDRPNALDLTWHLQQEIPAPAFGWDEIRRPYWMLKFLYDLGNVGPVSQSFLEWYWNPGDWRPAKQSFLPRPWGLPFFDPFTNPVDGVFMSGACFAGPNHRCTRLLNGTKLFGQGDYSRNPLENSQVGVRYHGLAPFGLEFTLNYFYQRWAGDDGTNYAPLRGIEKTFNDEIDRKRTLDTLGKGIFPVEAYMPYVHTIGASANYSDETFTQTVFRFETVYDVGVPFFDLSKVTIITDPALPGVTRKNMWKGFVGFDRPTWIKTVNKKTTVFFTGQFFWHYLVDNPSCEPSKVAAIPQDRRRFAGSCLVGGLDLPSQVRPTAFAFRDKIRDWETLATLAAFTFYRGGSIVPLLGIAVDTTNQFNMEPFWTVDYVLRDDLVVNVAQRYFVNPRGYHNPVYETWGLAGLNHGRSETSLRMTYQF